jgi:hypothetical protein
MSHLAKCTSPVQLACNHGLISFSEESTEKPVEDPGFIGAKILFEAQGKCFGKGKKVDEKRKVNAPKEQASLFCSRFFVLLKRKKRNPALGFCFFWAKPKERRRE